MVQIQDGNQPPRRPIMALHDEQTPGWALGLRQLYKVAADEPVPAELGDLLARLARRSARDSAH